MEEDIKNLKEIVDLCEEEIKNNDENTTAILDITDLKSLKNILNELERLQNENQEYERIIDIWDEREYRKKYLEEERAKRPKLLYPDADEIYKKYYELKTENENITRELLSRTNKLNELLIENARYKAKLEEDTTEEIEEIDIKDNKIQAISIVNYAYSISQPMKITINKINELVRAVNKLNNTTYKAENCMTD